MIPELGHYALVLVLALSPSLVQSVAPLIGARCGDAALMRLAASTVGIDFGGAGQPCDYSRPQSERKFALSHRLNA